MGEEEKSTAATEQQDECEDYAVDVTTASSWYKNVSYDDAKIFIRTNIESAARSFIAIGYYLKLIRDGELYREEGHESIWDFAMAEYGISKSTASRYMSMNDRFSLDGNSPIVDQKYKDFEKSKLQEMLSLTDEQLEQVKPEMKVQEIRAMRQPKEIPYFELEGQLDFETDFPEVFPEAPAVTQPATIQTTMTLEEMMGGTEPEEQPEKLSAYGTPKRVYPEGSLLTEPSCEGGHYCFSCPEMKCDIRGKERQCWYAPCGNPFPCEIVAERSLDLLTEQMGNQCQFVNHDLAYHCAGNEEAAPCCSRCENPCELACKRAAAEKELEETVATSQQETPSTVLETAAQPAANNHESAAEKQRSGKCLHNPLYDCSLADEDKVIPGTGEDCTNCCCWECPKHGDCRLECYASKRREVFESDADQEEAPEPVPEYDRELLTGMIFDQKSQLEQMGDGWKRNVPQAYTKHRMMLRAYEMLLEERDVADQEQEVVVQPELPVLRNNEQRAAFIDNYESWPLWIETQETGERYYRYDLPDGTSFVIRTYHYMQPDYVSGIGVRYAEGYGANEQYILEPGKFFRNCQSNRSSMIEKLKELQKGENDGKIN